MTYTAPAGGRYELSAWQDAAASVSLSGAANTRSAFEQLFAAVSRNICMAFRGPVACGGSRTLDVIGMAAHRLSSRAAGLSDATLRSILRDAALDSTLQYRMSTTRIVRGNTTGVLIRLVETSRQLALEPQAIEQCLATVTAEIRSAVAEMLDATAAAERLEDFHFTTTTGNSPALEIRRICAGPAAAADGAAPRSNGQVTFRKARLQVAADPRRGTEATVMFQFAAIPDLG